jgi:hypothetical protein
MQTILLDKYLDRKRLNTLLESVATQLNNLGQLGDKWLELCRQPIQQSNVCQCKDFLRTATCLSDMTTTFQMSQNMVEQDLTELQSFV